MLYLSSSVLLIPLAVSCPVPSWYTRVLTKEDCERQPGCKCSGSDPTQCSGCGECVDDTDCNESSHPACALGFPSTCVECNVASKKTPDCPSEKPLCYGNECQPTCSTSNYQCQAGTRIDAMNDRVCKDEWGSDGCDINCCGQCNSDGDCPDPSSPHCLAHAVGDDPYDQFVEADVGQCHECTSSDHCENSVCYRGKCSNCRQLLFSSLPGSCFLPCVKGSHECQLPCTTDSDCPEEGEICASNPEESEITGGAKRCQLQCSSEDDCVTGNRGWSTCKEFDGRKFCGPRSVVI